MIKEYKFKINYSHRFVLLEIPETIGCESCLHDIANLCDELLGTKHWWITLRNSLYGDDFSTIDLDILKQISFYICNNNLIYYFINN